DSRKKRLPAGDEFVALLVVPSLPIVPLKPLQLAGFRLVFCCNVQFAQMAGHDMMTLLPGRVRVSRGRNVPALVITVSVPSFQLPVIKSTRPSPLTSAAVRDSGPLPTFRVALKPKMPLPLLVSTV